MTLCFTLQCGEDPAGQVTVAGRRVLQRSTQVTQPGHVLINKDNITGGIDRDMTSQIRCSCELQDGKNMYRYH